MKKLFIILLLLGGLQVISASSLSNLQEQCQQEKPTDYLLGLTEGIRTTLMPKNIKTSLTNDAIVSTACKVTVAKNYSHKFNLMLRAQIRNLLQTR